jgi:hypothetical protein
MILEVSVHGWLTLLLWAYHGGSTWWRKVILLMTRKQKNEGKRKRKE